MQTGKPRESAPLASSGSAVGAALLRDRTNVTGTARGGPKLLLRSAGPPVVSLATSPVSPANFVPVREIPLTTFPNKRLQSLRSPKPRVRFGRALPETTSSAARVDKLAQVDFAGLQALPQLLANSCKIQLRIYVPCRNGLVAAEQWMPVGAAAKDLVPLVQDVGGWRFCAEDPQLQTPHGVLAYWPPAADMSNPRPSLLQAVAAFLGHSPVLVRTQVVATLLAQGEEASRTDLVAAPCRPW